MELTDREGLAGLRLLVAVAKADGVIRDEEKEAIAAALEGQAELTLDAVLEAKFDLDEEIAAFGTIESREQAYRSAHALANADGECSPEEQQLLEKIRAGFNLDAKQVTFMNRLFKEAKETVLVSAIKRIDDPAHRNKEVLEDTIKYAVLSAVLGAFPVPGVAIATDLAVVALQGKLVRDIGQYYGHTMDKKAAATILGGLGVGTAARVAVSNLMKFVPGWGSVFGATTSFASTYALGKVVNEYFEAGAKGDVSKLKKKFKEAEKEGKKQYEENKDTIATKTLESKAELDKLNQQLERGEITQSEYETRAAALV